VKNTDTVVHKAF